MPRTDARNVRAGSLNAMLLREASAAPTRLRDLSARVTARSGRAVGSRGASRAARVLTEWGLLTRSGHGEYALTRAGEAELDRLFEEAELAAWTAALIPAPAPADAARRTA